MNPFDELRRAREAAESRTKSYQEKLQKAEDRKQIHIEKYNSLIEGVLLDFRAAVCPNFRYRTTTDDCGFVWQIIGKDDQLSSIKYAQIRINFDDDGNPTTFTCQFMHKWRRCDLTRDGMISTLKSLASE